MRKVGLSAFLSMLLCISIGAPVRAEGDTTANAPQELTLNDVQDAGICLNLIRQQAINIYVEAARTQVTLQSKAEIPEIKTIPFPTASKEFLPARQQWLVYFLGFMEPVIRDLAKSVSSTKDGLNPIIPPRLKATIDPLWNSWSKGVGDLNHHLDVLVPLFDDAPHNNTKIQAVAVDIFNDINHLEQLRRTIFNTLKQIEQQSPQEKIKITAPDSDKP